jgi:hypothetical protein
MTPARAETAVGFVTVIVVDIVERAQTSRLKTTTQNHETFRLSVMMMLTHLPGGTSATFMALNKAI